MSGRANKTHPAVKHAGYSAVTILPGEDAVAFAKLHRDLATEFSPVGPLEESIVLDMAHLVWRKQNLATCRILDRVKKYCQQLARQSVPEPTPWFEGIDIGEVHKKQLQDAALVAEQETREELGRMAELIDIGEPVTIEGLMNELDVRGRLDGLIDKCLKRLLMVRGVKSLSLTGPAQQKVD